MDRFPGVAVVTGAARGIGASIVEALIEAGCRQVAITDILEPELAQLQTSLLERFGSTELSVLARCGDICQESFIEEFFSAIVTKFGRVDYLVNVAGVAGPLKRSILVTTDEFDFINNVNYRAAWLCSRAALKVMVAQEPLPAPESWRPPQRGSIVNIASQLGIVSRPCATPYCASKAAVISMTRSDAIDFSQDLVRVNCVCPGLVATEMTTPAGNVNQGYIESVKIAPMARMGHVREIADCVVFLSSYQASFVQGHAMIVDGGYVIN